jgi:hypothetical protein
MRTPEPKATEVVFDMNERSYKSDVYALFHRAFVPASHGLKAQEF